jgi:hypothetical protein
MARKTNAVKMATVVEALSAGTVDENAVLNDLLLELDDGGEVTIGAAPDEILEEAIIEPAIEAAIEPVVEAAAAEIAVEAELDAALAELPVEVAPTDATPVDAAPVKHRPIPDADFDDVALQAAIAEATAKAYAEQGAHASGSEADKPSEASEAGEKKGKGRPKADPSERHVVLSKSQKVASKLGEKASEFLVLELADAELDEAALKAKQDAVLAEIDGLAKKVSEKAVQLFGWLKNGGSLNEVMKRTFEVLAKDGEITSGEKGNLQQNLLAKPYSKGTAASQANQMFMLLPMLRVTKREKGRMIANPDSLILAKAKLELGL